MFCESSITELNRTQSRDWVRLNSISYVGGGGEIHELAFLIFHAKTNNGSLFVIDQLRIS